MTKAGSQTLESIATELGKTRAPPPVHLWNPPFCGDIDMRIAADGSWHYQGSPIGRAAMVRLFASVLKREGDKYFLVTPVEKLGIKVDDAPFLAVALETQNETPDRTLVFRTNVDEVVGCDSEHPLRFEEEAGTGGIKPYLHVRRDLWALVTRSLFLDLVALGEVRELDGRRLFGLVSAGQFCPMAPAEAVNAS
jgi:hypothetical protein